MFTQTPPRPLVLIVDDSLANLQIAGETLRELDCNLAFATSGLSALKSVEEEPPDLILLDVMMPDLSGLEVCRKIKAARRNAKIPVIFLTARTEPKDIVAGFEVGGTDYVTKPFNRIELLARVKTQLQIKEFADAIAAKNEELKRLIQVICHDLGNPFASLHGLLAVCADSPESLHDILPDLREISGRALRQIQSVGEMHRLQEGNRQLELIPFPIADAVRGAAQNLTTFYREKEIKLDLSIAPDLEVRVEPISFINTVLTNLLSNAAKFSSRGGTVVVRAKSGEDDTISLGIADQGCGIEPDRLPDLYLPTASISTPGTEGELGTGFGLAQVKSFTEAYGAQISIRSRHGPAHADDHGTTVVLTLRAA